VAVVIPVFRQFFRLAGRKMFFVSLMFPPEMLVTTVLIGP
jgi:hypothetical protein